MINMKIGNAYATLLGADFERMPKTVLAAVAVSLAARLGESADDLQAARALIFKEWRVLHENGIVPQAPPLRARDTEPKP